MASPPGSPGGPSGSPGRSAPPGPSGRRGGGQQPTRGPGLFVGRYFGVPVFFAPTWFIFAGFVTLSWAQVVRDNLPTLSDGQSYGVAFIFAVLLGISVLAHELGHTVVSLALGLRVRRIVLFLLGGVSEIESEPRKPAQEYLIAVAGPLVSLLLAAASAVGFDSLPNGSVQRWLVVQLMLSNLGVMLFNMLPGLPLDGGRLLRAAVWRLTGSSLTGTRASAWGGRLIAVAVVVGALFEERRANTVDYSTMVIALLLAAYLWVSAGQTLRVATMAEAVPELRAAELVRPTVHVDGAVSVAEALRRVGPVGPGSFVVTDSTGRPSGLASDVGVMAIPEHQRPWTALADVSRPLIAGLTLPDTLTGEALLEAMRATPATEYLVVGHGGETVGVLSTADVARELGRMGNGLAARAALNARGRP